jgi:hypothetical protein
LRASAACSRVWPVFCAAPLQRGAQAVGVEGAGQQVVDRDVARRQPRLPRQAGDEAGQAAARAVAQAQHVDRRLHRARW